MSSPDQGPARPAGRRTAAILLGLAVAVSGCQVRPLYAPTATGAGADSTVVAELSAIGIEPLRDRLGQSLVNELIFALRGGAALTDPRYRLRLIVTSRKSELAIQEFEDVPTANLIAVTASYTLTETRTGRVVTTGTTYTTASYDFSSQRFANLRAERDAEDRAAKAAAEDIRTRLAAVLATAPPPAPPTASGT
ncbi:LPS assembly lipoprotein LptE [Mongoliimonas terrestris]|uniref:LPS assembly lipoprotein LptE n=1 Tax=Mongoliimonas terrestris TaxID=1709001 RepID=UPI000949696C|nr:LPS assembly lipoprotein LptE [Mongoliimonas terrestris]